MKYITSVLITFIFLACTKSSNVYIAERNILNDDAKINGEYVEASFEKNIISVYYNDYCYLKYYDVLELSSNVSNDTLKLLAFSNYYEKIRDNPKVEVLLHELCKLRLDFQLEENIDSFRMVEFIYQWPHEGKLEEKRFDISEQIKIQNKEGL